MLRKLLLLAGLLGVACTVSADPSYKDRLIYYTVIKTPVYVTTLQVIHAGGKEAWLPTQDPKLQAGFMLGSSALEALADQLASKHKNKFLVWGIRFAAAGINFYDTRGNLRRLHGAGR